MGREGLKENASVIVIDICLVSFFYPHCKFEDVILFSQITILPLITAYELVSLRECLQILLQLLSESANFNDPRNLRFFQVFWGN